MRETRKLFLFFEFSAIYLHPILIIMENILHTENTESQRDYIIRRAAEMFLEQGIKVVRMDDIAHELGMSKRTLYEMFGDKRELLEQCLEHHLANVRRYTTEKIATAANVVEEIIIMIRLAHQVNDRCRMFMHSLDKYYPEIAERFRERQAQNGSERFHRMLQRGLDEGIFQADMNVEFTETIFSMTLQGLASSAKVKLPEGITMKDAMSYIIANFFRGLSTEKGLRMVDEYKLKNKDIYINIG